MNKKQYELVYHLVVDCGIGANEFFYPNEVGKTKSELPTLGHKYLKYGINGNGNSYVRLTQEVIEDMNTYREQEMKAYIASNPRQVEDDFNEGWDD